MLQKIQHLVENISQHVAIESHGIHNRPRGRKRILTGADPVYVTNDLFSRLKTVVWIAFQKSQDKLFKLQRDVLVDFGGEVWNEILVTTLNQSIDLINTKWKRAGT
jgi:hypothetical protein